MASYGQIPQQQNFATVNFGRLSVSRLKMLMKDTQQMVKFYAQLQSLEQYVEEHQLDVRPSATLAELALAVAQ